MTAAFQTIYSGLYNQIFAHASPFAKISEQLTEKVKLSGIGKLTTWSPQQFILNHPVLLYPYFSIFPCPGLILTIKKFLQATGWFVSHCGFNSITESLGSGIPLYGFPLNFL